MPKLIDGGKRTEYESYETYVEAQVKRSHTHDCPSSLDLNRRNIKELNDRGIKFTSLLDIGCRSFSWSDELTAAGKKCYGIDISHISVDYARSQGRDVRLGDAAELSKVFPDMKFDMIFSNHSLEHFLKPVDVLKECGRVLSENGHMLIKLPDEGPKVKDTVNYAHVRTYNESELRDLFNRAGLKIKHFEVLPKTHEFFIIVSN